MSNLPDVVRDEPSREITTADVDSWIGVASDVIRLANLIAPTEFVPKSLRDSAPATAAAILYGREVGLAPMTALTQTHVIEGKPAMSAEAMRALVLAAGHEIEVVETTRARCEMRGRRHGREKWQTIAVGIDEFTHLSRKDNWRNYPRQMLQARCTAELCRLAFPDVIHGFRAVEEFDEDAEQPAALSGTIESSSSTVRRTSKKTAAKKTTPPPLEQRDRPAIAGPPLPGEAGYETSPGGETPADDEAAVSESPATPPGDAEPATESNVGGSADHEPADTTDTDATENPGGEGEGEAPEPPGDSDPVPIRGPRKASRPQLRMIFARLKELNGGDDVSDADRHDIATALVGHRIESFEALTSDNAKTILDTLARVEDRDALDAILAAAAGGGDES